MTILNKMTPATGKQAEAKGIVVNFDSINQIDSQPGMLSFEIASLAVALTELAGRLTQEEWEFVKRIRENLIALAENAHELEKNLAVIHE